MSSNQDQVTFTLRVPVALQEAAKAHAKQEHISLNSLIVRLLEREVAQKGNP
ncbi:putative HicB family RNase H-like nuclease [Comamonas odontotermitis]|uniref:HicB family RNase H-like nuclease n=1 Tax=Comamonas odontotermitis TaxID=379895 RepID=A0ABR6RFP6_9BURK|nr:YlcI/YnfO family protein [Comamonas odontotermitis]MBB6577973.1 putative HicB family RNase H-like nuclease [Comamonas odontotermitis]